MSDKYDEPDRDEWFPVTLRHGIRQQCCSCGLVHDIEIRRRGSKLEMRIVRHERATAAVRRSKKKVQVIDD